MHISVNSQLLAQELRLLNKVAPTKAPLPILSHVLIRATDHLQFYATDLEAGLLTTCPAYITIPGTVALPVSTCLAMVERFPNADVTIFVDDKQQAHISCGAFTSRIQTLPITDFPTIPEKNGKSAPLNAQHFMQMATRCRYAVSETANKFVARGALLTLDGPVIAMVATDGKRLALATMPGQDSVSLRATIPIKPLDLLLAQPDLPEEITFTVGERHLFFTIGSRLLISRMLEGEFPNFQRIIPVECNKKATVRRDALSAALLRVGLVSGEDKSTRFRFLTDGVEITSSSAAVGDAGEKVALDYEGDPIEIYCNWQFVVDFLDVAKTPTVTLELKDEKTPLMLTEGRDHLGVVMLMQG